MIRTDFRNFNQHNRIHFAAQIHRMDGSEAQLQGRDSGLFRDRAVIDLNDNGRVDMDVWENGSFVEFRVTEPAFLTNYDAMKQMARRNGTDIIRQQDVRPVKVDEPGYTVNKWIWDRDESGPSTRNVRSLDSVIDEAGAFPRDAQWAVDTRRDLFLIYSPGRS